MFIELTDHLRCTAGHPEQFLVLLPDRMAGRSVEKGSLGCPVCGRVVTIDGGITDFGGGWRSERPTALTAPAVAALLGLTGPGGYLALFGSAASIAPDLAGLLPGIRMALINPPPPTISSESASVMLADRSPVKARSMRGVVIGSDPGDRPGWALDAASAVLPGNRVVGEGSPAEGLEVLATADGVWVGRSAPPGAR